MDDRIQKKELIKRVAARMKTNEVTAEIWIDTILDTLYDSFKAGQSVTLPGFGGFYVKLGRETWVVRLLRSKLRGIEREERQRRRSKLLGIALPSSDSSSTLDKSYERYLDGHQHTKERNRMTGRLFFQHLRQESHR